MTNKASIITAELKAKLELITVANGYSNDVQILDGWLTHYIKSDLNSGGVEITFPCIAIEPSSETISGRSDLSNTPVRTYKLVGAVSTSDPSQVTDNINKLLYDVRSSLGLVKESKNDSTAMRIILGDVEFKLPEQQYGQYAYFELTVDCVYNEEWKPKT